MKKQSITNSQTDRQNILNNPYAIKNIKDQITNLPIFEFEGKARVLKQDVVKFFELSEDTIDRTLSDFSEELAQNGYEVVTGKRLVGLKMAYVPRKSAENINPKSPQIGVFDFRSFLNIAMVLNSNKIAEDLRSKILDVVVSTMQEKSGASKKYINQRDENFLSSYITNKEVRKSFTDIINKYVEGNNNKYPYLTNMIYKDLFGENAGEYRKLLKLGSRENLRNTLYREILDIVSGYEEGITYSIEKTYVKKGALLTLEETEEVMKESFVSPFLRVPKQTAKRLMASRDKVFREIIHDALLPYIEALPEEEYMKFLNAESKITEEKTKNFIEMIDRNKEVFDRLKDR